MRKNRRKLMVAKMDAVVKEMVFITGCVLNQSRKFHLSKESAHTRRVALRLLEDHGLAKLVRRKGAPPTWTATESLIRQAGIFSGQAQPNPVHVPFDESPSAIFDRHRVRCINWVERRFKINCYGAQRQPGSNELITVPGLVLDAWGRMLRNAEAIEREHKYKATKVSRASKRTKNV
jgi:hypothetical protein